MILKTSFFPNKVIDFLPLELWCKQNFCLVSPVDISTQSFSNIVFSPAKFPELPSKSLRSSHSPKESSVSQEQLNTIFISQFCFNHEQLNAVVSVKNSWTLFYFTVFASTKSRWMHQFQSRVAEYDIFSQKQLNMIIYSPRSVFLQRRTSKDQSSMLPYNRSIPEI